MSSACPPRTDVGLARPKNITRIECYGISIAPMAIASRHQFAARRRTPSAPKKGRKLQDDELVHAVAVRANMRSILVAMMKSFSCSPLIFLVCRETVALPQPKLIFG